MSDSSKVLTAMKANLSPLDAQIFAQLADFAQKMTPLDLNRYLADGGDKLYPQLDSMNPNINNRLGVFIRALSLEFSQEATAAPGANGEETWQGQRKRITDNEKDRMAELDADIRKVSAEFEPKRAEASNNLAKAKQAETQARLEFEACQNNPSIGTVAIEASRRAAATAKANLATCANLDRAAHEAYSRNIKAAMPQKLRDSDPLGLGGQEVAKPPPI